MSSIKIELFGGEMPSISKDRLPPGGAQENRNLLLSSNEFRPLAIDVAAASAVSGTRTLYRFARDASGNFITNNSSGWISSTQDRSYVKGQVNDERTERTYFTTDDGSLPPQATDTSGAVRRLGVPRPVKLTATKVETSEFTREEANVFLYDTVAETIRAAIEASAPNPATSEPTTRFVGTTITAGPYNAYTCLFPTNASVPTTPTNYRANHWALYAPVTTARADAIALERPRMHVITSATSATTLLVPLVALPYTIIPNRTTLENSLRTIQYPTSAGTLSGTQVFTDAQITSLANTIIAELTPNNLVKSERDEMEGLLKEFLDLLNNRSVGTLPVQPVETSYTYVDTSVTPSVTRNITERPRGAEYRSTWTTDEYTSERSGAWVNYDAARLNYETALTAYNAAVLRNGPVYADINNRLSAIQARMVALTQEVESKYRNKWGQLVGNTTEVGNFIRSLGGATSLTPDAVDRVIDTRFYIATFVTDWGEESQPSPPSGILEVDQNDRVRILRPNPSVDTYASRNIVKYRIYRSNTGSETSAFQFVAEVGINDFIPNTTTPGYEDAKKSEELGEVCPTTTWAEPPYRMDAEFNGFPKPVVGTNPHLRGLVGMPNGIMAAFFDNTVAFSEPYAPYAWPVEYQITLEYPVVGMGVFGQTLFVGTTGNPYFISGADSASMSAQKLDTPQSCRSRKSIVAVEGGVLYVSPDGLCLASPAGVTNVLAASVSREEWQRLNLDSMFAEVHENIYYLFYTDAGGKKCISYDLINRKIGQVDLQADAVFVDKRNDTMFVANGTSITAVFGGATRRTGKWRSGVLTMPSQQPLAWVKVSGFPTEADPVVVRWYGDGVLRHTATFTNTNPQRLPPGRWLDHEVEIESRARVTGVTLAGSTQELQGI